jgi:hypothetical protein
MFHVTSTTITKDRAFGVTTPISQTSWLENLSASCFEVQNFWWHFFHDEHVTSGKMNFNSK